MRRVITPMARALSVKVQGNMSSVKRRRIYKSRYDDRHEKQVSSRIIIEIKLCSFVHVTEHDPALWSMFVDRIVKCINPADYDLFYFIIRQSGASCHGWQSVAITIDKVNLRAKFFDENTRVARNLNRLYNLYLPLCVFYTDVTIVL